MQDCRLAQKTRRLTIRSAEFPVTVGTSTSHSTFLTQPHRCKQLQHGSVGGGDRVRQGGQAAQAVCEVTVTEKFTRINDITSIITLDSRIVAKIRDLGLVDCIEGT